MTAWLEKKPQYKMKNPSTLNINSIERATSVVHTSIREFIL